MERRATSADPVTRYAKAVVKGTKIAGKVLTFKKMDAANTLTIRVGAGTVEGAATVSWATNGEVQGFVSDGSAWWRVVSA
jgi:hypothetical protein